MLYRGTHRRTRGSRARSLSFSLSLCLCLSLSLSVSLPLCLPLSFSLSLCLSVSLSPSLSLCLCLSVSFSLSTCVHAVEWGLSGRFGGTHRPWELIWPQEVGANGRPMPNYNADGKYVHLLLRLSAWSAVDCASRLTCRAAAACFPGTS